MQRKQVLFSLVLVVILTVLVSGIAIGKGHVPLGQVQVCHRGEAKAVDAPALGGHLGHGDIQLPACNGTVVFGNEADCSGVVDNDGDGKMDLRGRAKNDQVTSPACPAGTF